jgi:hypothetical protein
MPFMDRDSFIDLLNRLGDEDDQVVLAAARTIHARVAESGFGWNGLLLPAETHTRQVVPPDASIPTPIPAMTRPAVPVAEDETDTALIDRLLRDYALSDETRADLLEMKQQAERGILPGSDSKYIRDLAERLARATP